MALSSRVCLYSLYQPDGRVLPWWLRGEVSVYNVGDPGSIPGSGRSPGEENGSPPQYSCLESPMDRGAWQATVHGVARVGGD